MFSNRFTLACLTAVVLFSAAAHAQGPELLASPDASTAEAAQDDPACLDGPPLHQPRLAEGDVGSGDSWRPFARLRRRPAESCGVRPSLFEGTDGPRGGACWQRYPLSAGWFLGMVQGGAITNDWVGLNQGFQGGLRFGWDFHDRWGLETRFAYAAVEVYDSHRARLLQPEGDFDHRNAELFQLDLDLLYYPWGDTRLRPYLLSGLGATDLHFSDRLGERYHRFVFSLPLGVGLKYHCNDTMALRLDVIDDIAFLGGGLNTLNNVSLTLGVEYHFGGPRRTYWPWSPGRWGCVER